VVSVAIRFSMSNYGVSCESVFATEFVESGANQFRCRIVVSVANQFLRLNCGVSSKVVFTTELVSIANQFLLPNYVLPANQFSFSNFVF